MEIFVCVQEVQQYNIQYPIYNYLSEKQQGGHIVKKRTISIMLICALTVTQSWALPMFAENTVAVQEIYTTDNSKADTEEVTDVENDAIETDSEEAAAELEAETENSEEAVLLEEADSDIENVEAELSEEYGDFAYDATGAITAKEHKP